MKNHNSMGIKIKIKLQEQFTRTLTLMCKLYGYNDDIVSMLCSGEDTLSKVEKEAGYRSWVSDIKHHYMHCMRSSECDYVYLMLVLNVEWEKYLTNTKKSLHDMLLMSDEYLNTLREINKQFTVAPYVDFVNDERKHVLALCKAYGIGSSADTLSSISTYALCRKLKHTYKDLLHEYVLSVGEISSGEIYRCKSLLEFTSLDHLLGVLRDTKVNCLVYAHIAAPNGCRGSYYTFALKHGDNIVLRTYFSTHSGTGNHSWLEQLFVRPLGRKRYSDRVVGGPLKLLEKHALTPLHELHSDILVAVWTIFNMMEDEYVNVELVGREVCVTGKQVLDTHAIANDWVVKDLRRPVQDAAYRGDGYYQWVLEKYAPQIPSELLLVDELHDNVELPSGLTLKKGMRGFCCRTTLNPNLVGRRSDIEDKLRLVVRTRQCLLAGALCDQDYRENILPKFKEKLASYITQNRGQVVEKLLSSELYISKPCASSFMVSDVRHVAGKYVSTRAQVVTQYPIARDAIVAHGSICIDPTHAYVYDGLHSVSPTSVTEGAVKVRYKVEVELKCAQAVKELLGVDDDFLGDMIRWDGFTVHSDKNSNIDIVEPVESCMGCHCDFPSEKLSLCFFLSAKDWRMLKLSDTKNLTLLY